MSSGEVMIYSLGIEGTAHTFGASIITEEGEILANVIRTYQPEKGGIHPREAAQHHTEVAPQVIAKVFEESKIDPKELSIIAFSQGPGLGPCLRTTAVVARTLALRLGKPLSGVNHCVAHVEIGKLKTQLTDPLSLYLSGGNTLITAFDDGRYRVFGETLDIAVGNMLDTFARSAGLPHPGGPKIEKLARNGKSLIELPYTVKGMDLSFSGLLTAAKNRLKKNIRLEDLCYSLQETAFSMISEITERALAHTQCKELLLTGGVAQNLHLQKMLKQICNDHAADFAVVPANLAGDNGAMIAWTGVLMHQYNDHTELDKSRVKPRWRIDQVDISWIKNRGNHIDV